MYKKIREICKKRQINITALESALGFPRGSIYKWDVNRPSVDKVKKVSDYLDVPIEALLA